jgi:Transglutaminase-like superfamily
MRLLNDLRKLKRLSRPERGMLLEALIWIGAARIAILLFKFRHTARLLGLGQQITPVELTPAQSAVATRIGWAVRTAATRIPRANTCLVQTLAAAAMMRWREIPCMVCLGVAKGSSDIVAHAWLRCGDAVVTGENGHERFIPISAFVAW